MRAEGSDLSLTGAQGELHTVESLVLKSVPKKMMFVYGSKLPLKLPLEDHTLAVDMPDSDFPPELEEIPFYLVVYIVTQVCPTLCDPLDCSRPGSSVPGIFQARILEWIAIFLLQGIFPTQESRLLCLLHCKRIFYPLSRRGSPFCLAGHPKVAGLYLGVAVCENL